ncbi:MAG: hypothetical protein QOD59_2656 [Mycobacterium sp.]|nr:hypothetical protein [Mycobacterium sp.]
MASTRQSDRSGSSRPDFSAWSTTTCQVFSSAAYPPGTDIDSDSSDVPSAPASRGPDGEIIAAVDISGYGQVYGLM